MGTKNKYLWIVGAVFIGLVFTGCPKECVSPIRSYQAEYTVVHNDIIQVGDTIWIYSEMDCNSLLNKLTMTSESYCGNTFSFPIVLLKHEKMDSMYQFEGAVNKFQYINSQGRIYNDTSIPSSQSVNQVEFESQSNLHTLKIGFIPLEKGIYTFGLSNGGAIGKDHCNRASLENLIIDNSSDTDLLLIVTNYRERTEDELNKIFCFEVK